MPKKELIFFPSILLLGFFDWLTTITGTLFIATTEKSPLLFGLTNVNLVLFTTVKLLAIIIASLASTELQL